MGQNYITVGSRFCFKVTFIIEYILQYLFKMKVHFQNVHVAFLKGLQMG